MGYFSTAFFLGTVLIESGECLLGRHFEPRGNAETSGWRLTGDNSKQPAKREGLAEAHGDTEPVCSRQLGSSKYAAVMKVGWCICFWGVFGKHL